MADRILIVEDEGKLAGLLRDCLAQEGFEVSMLHRGDQVKDWVREHGADLILLDLMLFIEGGCMHGLVGLMLPRFSAGDFTVKKAVRVFASADA